MENKILKPFDPQEALTGKAVMLRNGRKAYVRHHETELDVNPDCKLLGYDEYVDHLTWRESGSYLSERITSEHDIIGMYPETRIINGFEVPAPETEAPKYGTDYYLALPTNIYFRSFENWVGDDKDKLWLERGLVFLSREDAAATAKAMLGIDPHSNVEKS